MNGPSSSGDLQTFTLQVRKALPYLAEFQDEILVFHLENPRKTRKQHRFLRIWCTSIRWDSVSFWFMDKMKDLNFKMNIPTIAFSELQ